MTNIPDIQSIKDTRNLVINQVGIKDLRMPISFKSTNGVQNTMAHFTMTVFLPAHQKGTHMSRFVELLAAQHSPFEFDSLKKLTFSMLKKLEADAGKITLSLPFFRQKKAPISGIESPLDYDLTLKSEVKNNAYHYTLQVLVPVTSLCPCSKKISQYGAHNQRSHVTITLSTQDSITPEEIIDLVEKQASAELYALLKRPDEKFVTERAYDNPKFVEDIVRDIATELLQDKRIRSFTVESENFESIHNHSAYACIQYP